MTNNTSSHLRYADSEAKKQSFSAGHSLSKDSKLHNTLSVHLQDFPNVSFIGDEKQLVADMDIIRNICTCCLFIRDKQNLRVRLPLNRLTIYGSQELLSNIHDYESLIKDEINVKEIKVICTSDAISKVAEPKLQINFKKVGAKFGSKMKEISFAAKQNKWQKSIDKNSGNQRIEIAGETLQDEENEFEIKLVPKDQNSTAALPSNDCVVQLDIIVTKELEEEGMARDIVRAIQQNRKTADLDVSDHIIIKLHSPDKKLLDGVQLYIDYIKEQTLTNKIEIVDNKEQTSSYQYNFSNKIEDIELNLGIELARNEKN